MRSSRPRSPSSRAATERAKTPFQAGATCGTPTTSSTTRRASVRVRQHLQPQAKVDLNSGRGGKYSPFDPEHTVYNKDYLLQILDGGKASLDEMKAAGQL